MLPGGVGVWEVDALDGAVERCGCEVPGPRGYSERGEEEQPAEQVEDELGWTRSGLGLPKKYRIGLPRLLGYGHVGRSV